jgi:hypothetical protein
MVRCHYAAEQSHHSPANYPAGRDKHFAGRPAEAIKRIASANVMNRGQIAVKPNPRTAGRNPSGS